MDQAVLSVEDGLGRIERIFFDAYNESEVLILAIENVYKRYGHYLERIHADKITETEHISIIARNMK